MKDDDVHVARKAAVLEAVVEKMDAGQVNALGGMVVLGNESGCVAIGPYIDRNVGIDGDVWASRAIRIGSSP